ncbi:MAG: hypothetical protein J6S14_15175 [Clostridia bacterium]|nr:hypothetical protein [Clostridia bacterium]
MKIILISGKAGSGKDEAAKIAKRVLEKEYGKRALITHFGGPVKFVAKEFFDWDEEKDEEGRNLLQWIGEKGREYYPTLWVDIIAELLNAFYEEWDYVILADTRYVSEIHGMQPNGTDRWTSPVTNARMECQTPRREMTEEQKNHISETNLDTYDFDWYINNDDTIETLEENVRIFLRNIVKEE